MQLQLNFLHRCTSAIARLSLETKEKLRNKEVGSLKDKAQGKHCGLDDCGWKSEHRFPGRLCGARIIQGFASGIKRGVGRSGERQEYRTSPMFGVSERTQAKEAAKLLPPPASAVSPLRLDLSRTCQHLKSQKMFARVPHTQSKPGQTSVQASRTSD